MPKPISVTHAPISSSDTPRCLSFVDRAESARDAERESEAVAEPEATSEVDKVAWRRNHASRLASAFRRRVDLTSASPNQQPTSAPSGKKMAGIIRLKSTNEWIATADTANTVAENNGSLRCDFLW